MPEEPKRKDRFCEGGIHYNDSHMLCKAGEAERHCLINCFNLPNTEEVIKAKLGNCSASDRYWNTSTWSFLKCRWGSSLTGRLKQRSKSSAKLASRIPWSKHYGSATVTSTKLPALLKMQHHLILKSVSTPQTEQIWSNILGPSICRMPRGQIHSFKVGGKRGQSWGDATVSHPPD